MQLNVTETLMTEYLLEAVKLNMSVTAFGLVAGSSTGPRVRTPVVLLKEYVLGSVSQCSASKAMTSSSVLPER